MKKYELISFPNPDALAHAAAAAWLDVIDAANRAAKRHCVALPGGRIAQKFFASTAQQTRSRNVSFHSVHFFWADERCVPPTDPESNFKSANEFLFIPLKIADAQIHRLRGESPPQAALERAVQDISTIAPANQDGWPVLDLIFLGMGEDGHTASLFQNAPSGPQNGTNCNTPFIFVPDSPKPPPRRISLNYDAIAAATLVWVLISGRGKEIALKKSLSAEAETPLGRVIRMRQDTKIFSDIQLKI
jgi:6-phosphogluconolactonase